MLINDIPERAARQQPYLRRLPQGLSGEGVHKVIGQNRSDRQARKACRPAQCGRRR